MREYTKRCAADIHTGNGTGFTGRNKDSDKGSEECARESDSDSDSDEARRARMNRVNPSFVLRNYLMHNAIERAERGEW